MSESRLPVPPLRIPVESLSRSLAGYDRDATRKLFEHLAGAYEALWLECGALRKREAELGDALAQRDQAEEEIALALIHAARAAYVIRQDARKEARLAMKKARERAASVQRRQELQASATAEAIVGNARRELRELELEIERLGRVARETRGEVSVRLKAVLSELDETFPPAQETPVLPEMRDELHRATIPFSSRASEGIGHAAEVDEDHGAAADVA
jgi:cell division septum initiation protein DivIVA